MLQLHIFDPESARWRQIDADTLRYPLNGDEKIWADLSTATLVEQQNLLHTNINGNKKSFLFTNKNTNESLSL